MTALIHVLGDEVEDENENMSIKYSWALHCESDLGVIQRSVNLSARKDVDLLPLRVNKNCRAPIDRRWWICGVAYKTTVGDHTSSPNLTCSRCAMEVSVERVAWWCELYGGKLYNHTECRIIKASK